MIEFSRFSRAHALAVVASTLVGLWAKQPLVLGVVAGVSFGVLVYRQRGHWTESGRFGLANAITTLRLALTLVSLAFGLWVPGWVIALNALLIVSLDGVDGWAARRFATQGEFGARYDTAVDSLFTLALSALLFVRGVLGPWVLIAGLWHYVYVLSVLIFPSEREAKRSFLGATVFVALVSTLGSAFVLPPEVSAWLVGITIAGQSASFVWSFWERYGQGQSSEVS